MIDQTLDSGAPPAAGVSVTTLQATLQRLFRDHADPRALALGLAAVGDSFEGVYAALQGTILGREIVEEWVWEDFDVAEGLREVVRDAMADAEAAGRARCSPLGSGAGGATPVLLSAPLFDAEHEVVGAAALIVGSCDQGRAGAVLAAFDGVLGYLALLIGRAERAAPEAPEGCIVIPADAERASRDPQFLAFAMAARLKTRHGFEQVAVGFPRGLRVRLAAVCGLDEVRRSNPGIKLVRAAMEECLDLREPVVAGGRVTVDALPTRTADVRMHAQWSRAIGGDACGSFPLLADGVVVAVLSVRRRAALDLPQLAALQREMAPYVSLLPLSRMASRGLLRHAGEAAGASLARLLGGSWKTMCRAGAVLAAALWVVFGSLPYGFTVPCTVVPAVPRTVSTPHEGILRELFVRPGDSVRHGQLLARLDADEERLQLATQQAEVRRLQAQVDQARADGRPGDAAVFTAQGAAVEAEIAHLEARISRAEIRAPADGLVLQGDLARRLGGKLAMGEPLFSLAHGAEIQVELEIPEAQVWEARGYRRATFAPAARPDLRIPLGALAMHPSSTPAHGRNVFLARSAAFLGPAHLTPGMEGVVNVEVGDRAVWWVLTHRVVDWMRLRFWF